MCVTLLYIRRCVQTSAWRLWRESRSRESQKPWIREERRAWQEKIADFSDEIVLRSVDRPILSTNRTSSPFCILYLCFCLSESDPIYSRKCHPLVVPSIISPSRPRRNVEHLRSYILPFYNYLLFIRNFISIVKIISTFNIIFLSFIILNYTLHYMYITHLKRKFMNNHKFLESYFIRSKNLSLL